MSKHEITIAADHHEAAGQLSGGGLKRNGCITWQLPSGTNDAEGTPANWMNY